MTIVDESMKLIKLMRDNGWIQVDDDVIWDAVGKDISFAKVMRTHSIDVTRRMGASSSPPTTPPTRPPTAPPAPKKAAKSKKESPVSTDVTQKLEEKLSKATDDIAILVSAAREAADQKVAEEKDLAGKKKYGDVRWATSIELEVTPEDLEEEHMRSRQHGFMPMPTGKWKLKTPKSSAAPQVHALLRPSQGFGMPTTRNGRPWPGI
jgi:hypothetical protein